MKSKQPLVSVLMPVFNSQKYLREAIQSILSQTFTDFEFLIINDGSSDDSAKIVKEFSDSKVRFIDNQKHQGLVSVLNQGIRLANGKYLARMDSDDISLPMRLEKQIAFMQDHPEIGICGTWYQTFGESIKDRVYTRPADSKADAAMIPFGDPFHHPTAVMRLDLIKKYGLLYDTSYRHLEDYEFWNRCSKYFDFANIGEVLFLYRQHSKQVGHLYKAEQAKQTRRVQRVCIEDLGIKVETKLVYLHWQIATRHFRPTQTFLKASQDWLLELITANNRSRVYDPTEFRNEIGRRWFMVCSDCSILGLWAFRRYWYAASIRKTSSSKRLTLLFTKCLMSTIANRLGIKRVLLALV